MQGLDLPTGLGDQECAVTKSSEYVGQKPGRCPAGGKHVVSGTPQHSLVLFGIWMVPVGHREGTCGASTGVCDWVGVGGAWLSNLEASCQTVAS